MVGSLNRGGNLCPPARKKENRCCNTTNTPPSEVLEVEPLLPLTQPLPREEANPQSGWQKNLPSPGMNMCGLAKQISCLGEMYQQLVVSFVAVLQYGNLSVVFCPQLLRLSNRREGERCVENGRVSACMLYQHKDIRNVHFILFRCVYCVHLPLSLDQTCLGFSRVMLSGLQEKLPFRCQQTSHDWMTQDTVSANYGCPSRTLESF